MGAAGAAGAGSKSCTGGFTEGKGAWGITVRGDTCATARKVAEHTVGRAPAGCLKVLDRKGRIGFKKPCVQFSYTCTATSTNQRRGLKVACTRGSRTIKFRY